MPTAPVVTPPTAWEKIEDLGSAIETTAKTILSKVSPATVATIATEFEAGVSTTFPFLAPVMADLNPYVQEFEALTSLAAQVLALKAVPVSPPSTPAT
jgi:hypothetical protein